MSNIIRQYYIINSEYNKVWFKQYIGKTLDELDFFKIVGHSVIQFKVIERKIRLPYKD